jgi:hypothetical protein
MATLKSLFLDENMYKLFDENGFVIIPFFNDFEITELKSIYGKTPKKNMVFESSSYIEDDFLSEKINNDVSEVFQPVINAVFSECKPLGTSFLTKKSGEDSSASGEEEEEDIANIDYLLGDGGSKQYISVKPSSEVSLM